MKWRRTKAANDAGRETKQEHSRSDGPLISHDQCEEGGGKTYDERARHNHLFVNKWELPWRLRIAQSS